MKSNYLLLIAVLFITSFAQAQHANIGIKGGLNAYTIDGDNVGNNDIKYSYHFGLLSHFHMTSKFALQPEIVYSVQGSQNDKIGSKLNLNYVNIPLLFQYMFDNGFRLQAGPQLGILVNAKSESGSTSTDVTDNFKSTDISLTAGLSYVKPSTGFGFDLRYNHGLTQINDGTPGSAYNRGVQLGLFYLFQHKS